MSFGLSDTYSPLRRVILRRPSSINPPDVSWAHWGYPSPRDPMVARQEHQAYATLLGSFGVEVHTLETDDPALIDACFACDPMVMTPFGAVLFHMGKVGRRGEDTQLRAQLKAMGIPILGEVKAPGTMEGGDLIWLGGRRLAVGIGHRTNPEGFKQLSALLASHHIALRPVELPWHTGPKHCLHLGSLLNLLGPDLAMVHRPLLSAQFCRELENGGYRLIDACPEEFHSQGNNILALAPRKVLMPEGNPVTQSRLEQEGVEVHTFRGDELCIKGTGGPTCLTQCLYRDHETPSP